MKKTVLLTALLTTFISLTLAEQSTPPTEELLPEVIKLVENSHQPIDTETFNNNLYIELLGAPYDTEDFESFYIPFLVKNHDDTLKHNRIFKDPEKLNAILEPLDYYPNVKVTSSIPILSFSDIDQAIIFPCGVYLSQNCMRETLQNKDKIADYIADNQKLFDRYDTIIQRNNPYRNTANLIFAEAPKFPLIRQYFYLQFSNAILNFANNQPDQGFQRLKIYQNYRDNLLTYQYDNDTVKLSTLSLLQHGFVQLLNSLLDNHIFDQNFNDSTLNNMFEPTALETQFLQALNQASAQEYLVSLSYMLPQYIFSKNPNIELTEEDEIVALLWFETMTIELITWIIENHYAHIFSDEKSNKIESKMKMESSVANCDTHSADELAIIRKNKIQTQFNRYQQYFADKNYPLSDIIGYFNHKYLIPATNQNYRDLIQLSELADDVTLAQKHIASIQSNPNREGFLLFYSHQKNRIKEYFVYQNMVYLKFLIMRDKIKDQDIPAFLASKAEYTKHPSRDEFIQWNPEKRTLSIPLSEAKKWLPANVRNSDATHWIVTIPK